MKVEFKGMEITCTTEEFQRLMQQGIFNTQSAGTDAWPGQVYPGNIQKLPDDFSPLPEGPSIRWQQNKGKPKDEFDEWIGGTRCVPLYGCVVDERLIDKTPKYDPSKSITVTKLTPDQQDAVASSIWGAKSAYEPETCTPGVSTCGVCSHSGVCKKEQDAKKHSDNSLKNDTAQ